MVCRFTTAHGSLCANPLGREEATPERPPNRSARPSGCCHVVSLRRSLGRPLRRSPPTPAGADAGPTTRNRTAERMRSPKPAECVHLLSVAPMGSFRPGWLGHLAGRRRLLVRARLGPPILPGRAWLRSSGAAGRARHRLAATGRPRGLTSACNCQSARARRCAWRMAGPVLL